MNAITIVSIDCLGIRIAHRTYFLIKQRIFRFVFGEQPVLMMVRTDLHAFEQATYPSTADREGLWRATHLIGQFIATPLADRTTGILRVITGFGRQICLLIRCNARWSARTLDVTEQFDDCFLECWYPFTALDADQSRPVVSPTPPPNSNRVVSQPNLSLNCLVVVPLLSQNDHAAACLQTDRGRSGRDEFLEQRELLLSHYHLGRLA